MQDISNHFNDYFINIGKELLNRIKPVSKTFRDYLTKKIHSSFKFKNTNPQEIAKILSELSNKNSTGHDMLSNKLKKSLSNALCVPLSILINQSLNSGRFPDVLKIAEVKPLHKAGQKTLMTNFRPISLLPVISKVYEKVVHKQTYLYFEENDLWNPNQYGFRPQHSCSDCLLKFATDIQKSFSGNAYGIACYCDLSKCFDTIPPNILIAKLKYYGMCNNSLLWFKDYFTNRQQCVKLDANTISETKPTITGIRQGSILGPLALCILINDLYEITKYCTVIGFADDTTIYHVYHNLITLYARVKKDLNDVSVWFAANQLSLNYSKTNCMIFSNSKIKGFVGLKLDDCTIERKTSVKLLGVTIDEKFTFVPHIDMLYQKLNGGKFALMSTKKLLSPSVKLRIYNSFILSHLQYGCEIWGPYLSKTRINKLQCFQNNCIRLILNLDNRASIKNEYSRLKILKIEDLVKYNQSKIMYKIENQIGPSNNCNLFQKAKHSYNTRNCDKSYQGKNNILESLITTWNQIENMVKLKPTLQCFKKNLKLSYMQRY